MYYDIVVFDLPSAVNSIYVYNIESSDVQIGARVKVNLNHAQRYGVVIKKHEEKVSYDVKDVIKLIDKESLVSAELIELAKWMSEFYSSSLSQTLRLVIPSTNTLATSRRNNTEEDAVENKKIVLCEEQEGIVKTVCENFLSRKSTFFYLYGVTGSGKTEVYLSIAKYIADSGKQVIYMVPEISLTIQLYSAVRRYFRKDEIAFVNSYVSHGRRTKAYQDAIKGNVKIIIGTRSAVFSPFNNLGLIIIDEEQDSSYKSDSTPSYHARQVAFKRAKTNNAILLMGSATPSFEAMKQIEDKKIEPLYLKKRINNYKLPQIIKVNYDSLDSPISDALYNLMRDILDKGKQIVLFLNRRGFLYHYKCQSCGFVKMCEYCSVSMTYHRESNSFVCHRCNNTAQMFNRCPVCGSRNEMYSGYGTEYVEECVRKLFPFAKTLRLDVDTTKHKGSYESIIKSFQNKDADILIGTQMVSKGLNFPSVVLVGILNATSSILSSDFRADEKLFSQLVQVAGRSGRFCDNGIVLLQCSESMSSVIRAVEEKRDEEFYKEQMLLRKNFSLPPYTRLLRFVVRGKDEDKLLHIFENLCLMIENYFKKNKSNNLDILTRGKCPLYKEKEMYRMHVILRSNLINTLCDIANYIRMDLRLTSDVKLSIDIDPYDFL